MWKVIKWLIFLIIIALIVATITGYKIAGKTVPDHVRSIVGAKNFDEGVKDMRILVGEAIKAAGDAVTPEATDDEKEELKRVIREEMKKTPPTNKQLPDTGQ